ncbi:MAG: cytochrome c oxidase assembly protein [Gammaproteobacteria bacterium]|nr:MAG: cytochrome c oxidase assembly protein [Gammaproteobacteria bacterium]
MEEKKKKNRVRLLVLLAVGMFGFSFAMVPLYELVCSVTGTNSIATNASTKTSGLETREVDSERWITVEFDATINGNLAVEFRPGTRRLKIHPGEMQSLVYHAKNLTDKKITLQAVPGITPWQATEHLHKIECFCFSQQTLEAGEAVEMPLRFYVDSDLPKQFERMTLSYSIMNIEGVIDAPEFELK